MATKTTVALQASQSLAAAGTNTGSGVDLTTAYGGLATGIVTNGGTGPTLACNWKVQTSVDNSTWRDSWVFTAGVTASITYTFAVEIPPGTMYIRSVFTGNTVQAVTIAAELAYITAL